MDTKPETALEQHLQNQDSNTAESHVDVSSEPAATSASPTTPTLPVPERLAEKRRREEEDEDELVRLAAGPKRRSSTSSNSSSGILNRKKTMSIGLIGSNNSGSPGASGGSTSGAAPKRIAINLGPVNKASASEDTACVESVSSESNEKKKQNDSEGGEGS